MKLLLLVSLIITCALALVAPHPPEQVPRLPESFRAETTFIMPFLGNNVGNLLVVDNWKQWCFQTSASQIALGNMPSSVSDNEPVSDEIDMNQQRKDWEENISSELGIDANENMYLTADIHDQEKGFMIWTKDGLLDKSQEALMGIFGPFMTSCPLMLEAFEQWQQLQPMDPDDSHLSSTNEEGLVGYQTPAKIYDGKFNATFYTTINDGSLRFLFLDGPEDYGLLAHIPVKFDNVEPLAAGSEAWCHPPSDDTLSTS